MTTKLLGQWSSKAAPERILLFVSAPFSVLHQMLNIDPPVLAFIIYSNSIYSFLFSKYSWNIFWYCLLKHRVWPVPYPVQNNSNRLFNRSALFTKCRLQLNNTVHTNWTKDRFLFQNNFIPNIHETRTELRKELGICFPCKSRESKRRTKILPLTFDLLLLLFFLQSLALFFNYLLCSSSMTSSQLILACKRWNKLFGKCSRFSLFEHIFLHLWRMHK